jgi:hypothetical protein
MAEIHYKSSAMCGVSEPRDQSSGGTIYKIAICLTETGIPMLEMN